MNNEVLRFERPELEATHEWLETDGLGGFASGTALGWRTRRYHGLLTAALRPPTERCMLVQAVDVWVEAEGSARALSSHRYRPDVTHPDGSARLQRFAARPWPTWEYQLDDGTRIVHEILVERGAPRVALSWRQVGGPRGDRKLWVRPLLSGRDLHALHHQNSAFRFEAARRGEHVLWTPYGGSPTIAAAASGPYRAEPAWYCNFLLEEERARGFECSEDLAAPGVFELEMGANEACLLLWAEAEGLDSVAPLPGADAVAQLAALRKRESARRRGFATVLDHSAEDYLVQSRDGRTVIAGYPWFTDWGRDTFLAMRGLCLARQRLDDAGEVLLRWAAQVSEGMLPNRFPDSGEAAEFNSVDASLWFVVVVSEYLEARRRVRKKGRVPGEARLKAAVQAILEGYSGGTRFGIRSDGDGLLRAGEPGWQLTWMDARAEGREVTPRIGKPVEVQALWIHALEVGARFDSRWKEPAGRAGETFLRRFWNPSADALFDVIDVDHQPGHDDPSLRPNQILAIGGLSRCLVPMEHARRIVDRVERELWTPRGLRSLGPQEPGYCARYQGGPAARDGAYHQGTVWPWWVGPFVDAWVAVRGPRPEVLAEARVRFVDPLLAHLREAGLGHISEIADGEAPHRPNGCPFQAWSLGELLRVQRGVLAPVCAPDRIQATSG